MRKRAGNAPRAPLFVIVIVALQRGSAWSRSRTDTSRPRISLRAEWSPTAASRSWAPPHRPAFVRLIR
jgi:hypothetical protein